MLNETYFAYNVCDADFRRDFQIQRFHNNKRYYFMISHKPKIKIQVEPIKMGNYNILVIRPADPEASVDAWVEISDWISKHVPKGTLHICTGDEWRKFVKNMSDLLG